MRPGPDGLRNATLATHLDHCVEILRQVLSCNGDAGLITYHWVKGNPTTYPDFNTWHQCRDAEAILAWSKQREAPIKVPLAKQLFPAHHELDEAP
ncbi:hypothetical protein VHEMI04123 [[Torrubiella] hemipterigena]|uniref:Uncharacterized protein n=1 Tax=[Torrubiella] hemipterigena TaxID=1531966 RepID=A0A0A1T0G3_9HYPO|nr:hypothetical protein VHEMI04123 [[Torrubiella] hemipterigena]